MQDTGGQARRWFSAARRRGWPRLTAIRRWRRLGGAAGEPGDKQPQRHEHPKEHGKETERSLPVLYQRARTSTSTAP